MLSWIDKVRGLSARFLSAVGAGSAPENAPDNMPQADTPSDWLMAQYAIFKGYEKGASFHSARAQRYAQLLDHNPEIVLKAHGILLSARARRDPEDGLWHMSVCTDGRICLSDDPEKALTSHGILFHHEIKPFEARLVALGFAKSTEQIFGCFETIVFERHRLSDRAVDYVFGALDAMLSQDEKVISLSGTRHDVAPKYQPGSRYRAKVLPFVRP